MVNVFILDDTNEIKEIAKALRLSKHKNIRIWILSAWADVPPYKFWKDKHVIDKNIGELTNQYFEWNIFTTEVYPLSNELRSLWWRIKNQNMVFCILTNMPQPKNRKVMFEDSRTDDTYPTDFESIRCFSDYDGLMNYCKETGEVRFSLKDPSFFTHAHDIPNVKGAEVYREIATNRLWYLDTFHKDHYEVFDRIGHNHLGEADLNGVIDFKKADNSKKPIN